MNALRFRSGLLALALLSRCAVNAHAADELSKAEREAEAREMLEEDRVEVPRNSNFTGKFTLYTDAQIKSSGDPTVIGRFDSGADDSKLVRTVNEKAKADLKKLTGKDIVVNGRARLSGKYLYVTRVIPVGPGNAFVAPAGGL